jgi:hypothetical protein
MAEFPTTLKQEYVKIIDDTSIEKDISSDDGLSFDNIDPNVIVQLLSSSIEPQETIDGTAFWKYYGNIKWSCLMPLQKDIVVAFWNFNLNEEVRRRLLAIARVATIVYNVKEPSPYDHDKCRLLHLMFDPAAAETWQQYPLKPR